MAEKPASNPTILAVLSTREDRTSLAGIFAQSNWRLRFTRALPQAQTVLGKLTVGVVISEACLSDGHCWRELLHEMQKLGDPPPLIVADRLADERLWAEALNLGAYDLLAKPFDPREVLYAVTTACRHSETEHEMTLVRETAMTAKRGSTAEMRASAVVGR